VAIGFAATLVGMPLAPALRRLLGLRNAVSGVVVHRPTDETRLDPETGAVTSRQAADVDLAAAELDAIWDPEHLERLARTYWSSLRRFTFGLVHVRYTERERFVVLLIPQLRLLSFAAPEYEMDGRRGIVRWQIERGLLVSRGARDGGYLEIEVERGDAPGDGLARVRIAIEVANYYPRLTGISRRAYAQTQSRIHVLACNFFLRRLAGRELEASKIGSFAGPPSAEQAPDPRP
jgi:hypothetical protein